MSAVPTTLVEAVERAVGRRALEWRIPHAGMSAAMRYVVTLAGGGSVFVKAAVNDETEQWLRNDFVAMTAAGELAPEIIAWTEADGRPAIVMESLHEAHWPAGVFEVPGTEADPVVWRPGQIDRLFEALDTLGTVTVPDGLGPLHNVYEPQWHRIADDPATFHGLGLAEHGWFEASLPVLLAAEDALDLMGEVLVHNDVRSDNVCFRHDGRVVLADWSQARRGAAGFDLANLVQTLPLEGGPNPHDVLPDAAPFAAWRAGEMINRAAGRWGPNPAWLVKVFKRIALIDLRWVSESVGLPLAPLRDWRSI